MHYCRDRSAARTSLRPRLVRKVYLQLKGLSVTKRLRESIFVRFQQDSVKTHMRRKFVDGSSSLAALTFQLSDLPELT